MAYNPLSQIDPRFLRNPVGPVVSDNERQVLRILHRNPRLSRAELTAKFDLRQQSLHRIVDQLATRGMVRLGPPRMAKGRGQPSPTLELRADFAFSWGIALNAEDLGLVLMDFSGKPVLQESHRFHGRSRDTMLEALVTRMATIMKERALDPDICLGVGFGLPGYWVDPTRFSAPEPLEEWSLIELGPMLNRRLGWPVWVDSGANTAAVAEAMLGIGRDIPTFAHISFSYGMGIGLVHEGDLWMGGHSNAGELSALYTPEEMQYRPTLSSLLQHLRQHGAPITSLTELQDRFDPHCPLLEPWINRAMPLFNRALAALWAVFDPQAVVLGGQMPPVLTSMLIDRTVFRPTTRYGVSRPTPALVVSDLGPNAPALGAAAYPLRICAL